jgi:hypothetical protein
VAWIVGLHQDGKLVTADVEFTRRGAKTVRNGDYKFTSPTFVANYADGHREKDGPALTAAHSRTDPCSGEALRRSHSHARSLRRGRHDPQTPQERTHHEEAEQDRAQDAEPLHGQEGDHATALQGQPEADAEGAPQLEPSARPSGIAPAGSPDTVITLAPYAPREFSMRGRLAGTRRRAARAACRQASMTPGGHCTV